MKKLVSVLLAVLLLPASALAAALEQGAPFALQTPSYVLMEASTGNVIFEHNADQQRPVASVTKLMTILLALEALEAGTISLGDMVMVSREAAGMGGSQALLDAGSAYKLEELLKSTIVASANDAAVALAEHIAGTEQNFVSRMNERALELALSGTVYKNTTGLPAAGQHTTARDVANLSRELAKHPQYFKYSTIWMDTIEHKGGRVTDLTNTNRLVRFYEGCDGFKTGSTNEAKYCVSATAKKDGMRLIAVVLGTPASQTRFNEARQMLEYGFASYRLFSVCQQGDRLGMQVAVTRGGMDAVDVAAGESLTVLLKRGEESGISLEVALPDAIEAPVLRGDVLGEIRVLKDGQRVGTLPAVADADVRLPGYLEALLRILNGWR
ncbi:MAG: D-alanyl-D-alanine carboxypeptidase [Firmicutes bacterium]|nr:D-alanyl-D-alanine carboxypeptidase [Bacillota bacterium]